MSTYIKRPIPIEAVQINGTDSEDQKTWPAWVFRAWQSEKGNVGAMWLRADKNLMVGTLEGHLCITPGDYLIQGIRGELYPCKESIFKEAYWSEDEYLRGKEVNTVGLDFGGALALMEQGAKVSRKGWNGRGIFIKIQFPDENSKMTGQYIYIDTTGLLTDNPDAPKVRIPWLASQTDMQAKDWTLVA